MSENEFLAAELKKLLCEGLITAEVYKRTLQEWKIEEVIRDEDK